jgi:hypothetical protein
MRIINLVNDLSIKRIWRIIFRSAQFFPILSLIILLNAKNIPDSLMIIFFVFMLLLTTIVFRIRWLYLNKKETLQ